MECPICGLMFPERLINRHLDNICLKRAETQTADNTTQSALHHFVTINIFGITIFNYRRRYSKIPRMVYQIMKDRQLKAKLKEFHLSTSGDRQVRIFFGIWHIAALILGTEESVLISEVS